MINRTKKKKAVDYLQTIHKHEKDIKYQLNDSLWIFHSAYI